MSKPVQSFSQAELLFEKHKPHDLRLARAIAIEQCLAQGTSDVQRVFRELVHRGYYQGRLERAESGGTAEHRWLGGVFRGLLWEKTGRVLDAGNSERNTHSANGRIVQEWRLQPHLQGRTRDELVAMLPEPT